MIKKIFLVLAVILVFVAVGPSGYSQQELTISLKEKQIKDFSLSGLSLVFYVNITNASSFPYYLYSYEYRLLVNQKEYFHLAIPLGKSLIIEAKKDTLLSIPLKVTYKRLFKAVEGIEKENKAQCMLSGTMTFWDGKTTTVQLPFAFSGDFQIFQKPEIEFRSFHVNDMTIGGADLTFQMSFKNNNTFELLVDRISYTFYLEGQQIEKGLIKGDKNIESRGEKVFSLQFLMSFFEVGKEMYQVLQQSSASLSIAGEIEVRTAWGRLTIPFNKREDVTISRTS